MQCFIITIKNINKMTRRNEKILPFSWEGFDEQDMMHFSFYDVIFSEDFGILKKDLLYACVDVDYDGGLITIHDSNTGDIIGSQSFKCTPI